MSDPDYFAHVEAFVKRARDAQKAVNRLTDTHWSSHDAPQWALCGARIRPEQFARVPSCPDCLQALEAQRLEDQR